jgi:hypothetical protein
MGALIKDLALKPLFRQRLSAHCTENTPQMTIPPIPLQFDVYHGSVQEALIGQVPFVHGEGRSFLGFGHSRVTTEVIKETSLWLRDHQTGKEHRFDLGEVDLPARAGHNVTLLWVNRQLYAIHNYSSGETKYFELHPSVAPFRKERFRGLVGVVLALLGVPLFGMVVLPLIIGVCAYPLLAAVGRPDLWTPRAIDPYIAASIPWLVPALMILTAVLVFLRNKEIRTYNCAIRGGLQREIDSAMEQHVFAYPSCTPDLRSKRAAG